MNPSVEAQQRRVVSALVRRNLQGWGRPLDFTVQRLRMGLIFGALGAVFFVLRQSVAQSSSSSAFFSTVLSLLVLFSLAFCLSFLFSHAVPFLRARSQTTTAISGKIEAVICDARDYTAVAQGDYHFITVRTTAGPLRAFAVEAAQHQDICTRRGQQVQIEVIPGIERVVSIR